MLAIVLICALGQQPWECQRPTARDVMVFHTEARLPYACLREAQMHAAEVSQTRDLTGEWLKIGCEPEPKDDL